VGGSELIPAGDFQTDKWYALLLFVDSDEGFRLRAWQVDDPQIGGEGVLGGWSGTDWSFRTRVNNGDLWLDSYAEGKAYSEEETLYTAEVQHQGSYPDQQVVWAHPVETIQRTYEGDGSWSGTRQVYQYEEADQGSQQYGNLTRTIYSAWDAAASDWVEHHAVWLQYYPQTGNGKYLVSLPARQSVVSCSPTCDFSESGMLADTLFLYDSNTSYAAAPTEGQLSIRREWMDANGQSGAWRYSQTSYGYDAWGNPGSLTTWSAYAAAGSPPGGTGAVTTYTYDDTYHAYPVSETNALGRVTTTTYNALGLPLEVVDANGERTAAVYDSLGRMTAVCAPEDWRYGISFCSSDTGQATLSIAYTEYSDSSHPFHILLTQKVTNEQSLQIVRYYSGTGLLLQEQTLSAEVAGSGAPQTANIVSDSIYNALGQLVKQTHPYTYSGPAHFVTQDAARAGSTFVYDLLGRVVSESQADGSQATWTYTDRQAAQTDANGHTTTQRYDAWGQVIEVIPPTGARLQYSYDRLGRLEEVLRGSASTPPLTLAETHMTYDAGGRKIAMQDADMGSWTYAYDAAGNLSMQTDARGCSVSQTYDLLQRLTLKQYGVGCGTGNPDVRYYYDGASFTFDGITYGGGEHAIGQRTGMVDASGASVWGYDGRGRLVEETRVVMDGIIEMGIYRTAWGYTSDDQVAWMEYPNGERVAYTYNPQGLAEELSHLTLSGTQLISSLAYDESGRVRQRSDGNGVSVQYSYYAWQQQGGRLQSISAGSLQNLAYSYDVAGNITQIGDSIHNEVESFTYDALDRLELASGAYSEDPQYDAASGQMLSRNGVSKRGKST